MTLRLLRNLRITRPNTRPASERAGESLQAAPGFDALGAGSAPVVSSRRREPAVPRSIFALCLAACCAVSHAGDEPADPISKLGQRSALQRWKDARQEWMSPGLLRRDRRRQKHEGPTEPPVEPERMTPAELPKTPVQPMPGFVSVPLEEPQFPAPPRGESSNPTSPATPDAIEPSATASDAGPSTSVSVTDDPFTPIGPPLKIVEAPEESPAIPAEPAAPVLPDQADESAVSVPLPVELPTPMPAESRTANLPQIPRTPIDPTPTPAPPPPRFAPAPEQRLPEDDLPPFLAPRRDPLVPPEPEQRDVPRAEPPGSIVAGHLPQLRPITTIQPFRNCSTDGAGVKMCPPNSSGSDRCPEQQPLPEFGMKDRNAVDLAYCWDASNLHHTPLYFEDVVLERYGHTYCEPVQSIVSAGKFGVDLIGLPYQMALAPIHKREYPLGYYRPGDPAPYKAYQIPWNRDAAFKAAYFYTGMSFIVP